MAHTLNNTLNFSLETVLLSSLIIQKIQSTLLKNLYQISTFTYLSTLLLCYNDIYSVGGDGLEIYQIFKIKTGFKEKIAPR